MSDIDKEREKTIAEIMAIIQDFNDYTCTSYERITIRSLIKRIKKRLKD